MSRALLLSVRPRFAQALLNGTKTAEIRRRFPNVPAGTTVVIYSSSPERAVLGTMRARALVRSTVSDIWDRYAEVIGINERELRDYLDGAAKPSVLEVDSPSIWPNPVGLGALRRILDIEPAQSFRYLTARQVAELEVTGSLPSTVDGRPIYPYAARSRPALI